jgi:hypothetical protein
MKGKRKKKKRVVWRQLCECLSEAVAHLLPTVSQLMLQALFIADLRYELYTHLAPQAFSFRVLVDACPFCFLQHTTLHTCCNFSFVLFRVCVERCPSPLCWGACHTEEVAPHLPSLADLFTVRMRECPSPTLQSSGHPALFAMCLFIFQLLIIQFFFFLPWVGVSLSTRLC